MFRSSVLALTLSAVAPYAYAAGLCDQVTAVLSQDVITEQSVVMGQAGISQCTRSLDLSGASALNCAWPFPFREGAARKTFDVAFAQLQSCFGADASEDQPVNHPDFYDLRMFQTPQGEVGLSLKDKGALQQTYVFLRMAPTR